MGLSNVGRDFIAQAIINDGSPTFFDNANAYIGVGNGTTAFEKTQTDLVGANKVRKKVDADYPIRSANAIDFRATYGANDANFDWEEWGVFNASTGGVMLNRKVENLGTKASGSIWVLTVTITVNN